MGADGEGNNRVALDEKSGPQIAFDDDCVNGALKDGGEMVNLVGAQSLVEGIDFENAELCTGAGLLACWAAGSARNCAQNFFVGLYW